MPLQCRLFFIFSFFISTQPRRETANLHPWKIYILCWCFFYLFPLEKLWRKSLKRSNNAGIMLLWVIFKSLILQLTWVRISLNSFFEPVSILSFSNLMHYSRWFCKKKSLFYIYKPFFFLHSIFHKTQSTFPFFHWRHTLMKKFLRSKVHFILVIYIMSWIAMSTGKIFCE